MKNMWKKSCSIRSLIEEARRKKVGRCLEHQMRSEGAEAGKSMTNQKKESHPTAWLEEVTEVITLTRETKLEFWKKCKIIESVKLNVLLIIKKPPYCISFLCIFALLATMGVWPLRERGLLLEWYGFENKNNISLFTTTNNSRLFVPFALVKIFEPYLGFK